MKYNLLKNLVKFCRRILQQKLNQRIIYFLILALISLICVFGIHNLLLERAIATETLAQQFSTKTSQLTPEKLSNLARQSYNQGHFGEAIDYWKQAIAGYKKLDNKTETINNQINLAQAEQALGYFPRACSTLLEIYDKKANCKNLLVEDREEGDKFFKDKLPELADSPSKVAGLRLLANVLRGFGELDWSHEVLLLSLEKSQPSQEQAAIWLDLGNTRRALSNKEQDLYKRSQQKENLICGIINGYGATQAYEKAEEISSNLPSNNIKLQSQLNQLSLALDLQDYKNKFSTQKNILKDFLDQLINPNDFLVYKAQECWKNLGMNQLEKNFTDEITDEKSPDLLSNLNEFKLIEKINPWLKNQLSEQNPLIQLAQINQLQQQIEQLLETHAALFTRLNFAKNLIRMTDDKDNILASKIEQSLKFSIDRAKSLGDSNMASYGYGYLGELYEKLGEFELAQENTRKALSIAQSIALGSQTEYLWEWQLGRIYESQFRVETLAQTKGIEKKNSNNLNAAREMYGLAYNTLQSLRRDLVAGNSDVQFSFQDNIETVYRNYVNLLLWDKPDQEKLSQARKVIASLQAVQLENFLRLSCPEYQVEDIDKIVDKEAQNTAFLYPILLENKDLGDRIEVILKLPNQPKLERYSTKIDPDIFKDVKDVENFEDYIRKFQRDLEEAYTFQEVRKEGKIFYDLLLKGAEKLIGKDANINTLVFALDTKLRNIPLAALVVDDQIDPNDPNKKQPTYLIDKYAVALAPSLEIPTPRNLQNQKDKKLNVLAAGLTKPNREEYEGEFPEYLQKFSKLRFTKKEIEKIEEIDSSKISLAKLIDDDFQTKQLEKKVDNLTFEIIHLATHGEFSSSPEKTFLLAYDRPIFVNQLDNIFRRQAQNQPVPVELIVLNACETAAGDQRATLGISGVAVRAGARSAIASLWTLNDEISSEFTKMLYEQLVKPGLTKAQALQKAQRKLKNTSGYEHPRYWAPYILVGNWLEL